MTLGSLFNVFKIIHIISYFMYWLWHWMTLWSYLLVKYIHLIQIHICWDKWFRLEVFQRRRPKKWNINFFSSFHDFFCASDPVFIQDRRVGITGGTATGGYGRTGGGTGMSLCARACSQSNRNMEQNCDGMNFWHRQRDLQRSKRKRCRIENCPDFTILVSHVEY